MTPGSHSELYYRNGRTLTQRPWHWRLTELAHTLQVKRDRARSYAKRDYWAGLLHRAWELSPQHFAYEPVAAEKAWLRYLAAEATHG